MDEYSDMVAVAKPVVYITMGELVNTHRVRACASLGQWVGGLALEGKVPLWVEWNEESSGAGGCGRRVGLGRK